MTEQRSADWSRLVNLRLKLIDQSYIKEIASAQRRMSELCAPVTRKNGDADENYSYRQEILANVHLFRRTEAFGILKKKGNRSIHWNYLIALKLSSQLEEICFQSKLLYLRSSLFNVEHGGSGACSSRFHRISLFSPRVAGKTVIRNRPARNREIDSSVKLFRQSI